MTRLERWATAALLWGALCAGCAGHASRGVPLMLRPDTRSIGLLVLDSMVVRHMAEHFQAAYPKEAAVCLSGSVRDTLVTGGVWLLVTVTEVRPARADSADQFHVWFPATPQSGCADPLIGVGHNHVYVPPMVPCTHSDRDAFTLFAERRALFSIVFCGDGRSEALMQDGRRIPAWWAS